jgi:hypothetical protein
MSADSLKKNLFVLEFPKNNIAALDNFWARLAGLVQSGELLRIMHFGDSQIEDDRMSSYIRNQMQRRFGGSGVGLRPAKQAFDFQGSIRQTNEGAWARFTSYGTSKVKPPHSRYGAACNFVRFSPFYNDSLPNDTMVYKASVNFEKSNFAYQTARKFQKVRLFYANNHKHFGLHAFANGVKISHDSVPPHTGLNVKTWKLPKSAENFSLHFAGKDSPEIYGIALDGDKGIAVDNIAMRGCSGLIFTRMDRGVMKNMFDQMKVGLIILQFGGNVTPYIKDNYAYYEKDFYRQLMVLRTMLPNVPIVVIGPADMSRNVNGNLESYPNIPLIRDALRSATFRAGGAFWDLYEAMGGRNSMPSWVAHKPTLAEKDYVHFNQNGARIVAEMFYKALIYEYERYKENGR